MDADLQAYHALYEATAQPRLYSAPWWLDATCGQGGWSTLFLRRPGKGPVGLAFLSTRIRGLRASITPPFSQWVTPVGPDPESHDMLSLLRQLPAASIQDLCFLPWEQHIPEALPWPVHLKYTYIIPRADQMQDHRSRYNEGLKRNLKSAEAEYAIRSSDDVSLFLTLCVSSYRQRRQKPPGWWGDVIPVVFQALRDHSCGQILVAYKNQQAVAAIMTAQDTHAMYYLAGGRDDQAQSVSAHSLLLDQAIQSSMRQGLSFDFEGSMHPGIASFFQAFGSIPRPYWQIRQFRGLGRWWALLHSS